MGGTLHFTQKKLLTFVTAVVKCDEKVNVYRLHPGFIEKMIALYLTVCTKGVYKYATTLHIASWSAS